MSDLMDRIMPAIEGQIQDVAHSPDCGKGVGFNLAVTTVAVAIISALAVGGILTDPIVFGAVIGTSSLASVGMTFLTLNKKDAIGSKIYLALVAISFVACMTISGLTLAGALSPYAAGWVFMSFGVGTLCLAAFGGGVGMCVATEKFRSKIIEMKQ